MYLTNARSLRNKFNELSSVILTYDLDVICVTESWISEFYNGDLLSEFEIHGYRSYLYQRNDSKGGGVILYVRDGFTVRSLDSIKVDPCVESVWLDLKCIDNTWVRIALFYRSPCPPNGKDHNYIKWLNNKYIEEINRGIENIRNDVVLLLGDFNYSNVDWELLHARDDISQSFLDCIQENFLEQVVHECTRGTRCLDLVLTNQSNIVNNMHVLAPLGNSDHNSLCFELNLNMQIASNNKHKYNYNKGNYNKFRRSLNDINWDQLFMNKNCNDMWDLFKITLDKLQKECIPIVKSRSGDFKHKPGWWDNDIANLIKQKNESYKKIKNNCYSIQDLDNFRSIRDRVKRVIRSKKIQEDINISKEKDTKQLFKKYKIKSKFKNEINFIKIGDQVFSGDKNISEGFNNFFSSVFNMPNKDANIVNTVPDTARNLDSISNLVVTKDEVVNLINKLDINKGCGPDGVSNRILKEGIDSLSLALTLIFNKSLTEAVIPNDWKLANVVPVFKKGNREVVSNYRPISLTSVVCRLLEKVIKIKLINFLDRFKLINKTQHGFTNKRSCLTNLLEYVDYVTNIINNGDTADVVYLDLSKAFDKVSHSKLIQKLWRYGIKNSLLNWIRDWLTDRKQRVVLNGEYSDWIAVTSGVPQGSVLGPLLFTMYINDLELGLSNKIFKFADDTKLVITINDFKDNFKGQKDLDKLVGWCNRNDMNFNTQKCKVLHMGHKNSHFNYNMNGEWIESSCCEKDLGVHVDERLTFSKQCLESRNKANRMLGYIARNVSHKSKEVIKRLYNAYVRPHLEYCVQAWSPHYRKDIEMLEKVQRRATKLINGFDRLDYESRLRELDMFSLERRYKRGDMIEVYKIFNGMDDLCFEDFFELDLGGRRGHSKKLKTKKSRLDVRRYSFSVRVVDLWNKLSEETVSSETLDCFKRLLDRDMDKMRW